MIGDVLVIRFGICKFFSVEGDPRFREDDVAGSVRSAVVITSSHKRTA